MKIIMRINAEIVIVCDDMKHENEPAPEVGKQTKVTDFKPKKSASIKKNREGNLVANWLKDSPRDERSDIGTQHRCTRCGALGRRRVRRLNNRCHSCKDLDNVWKNGEFDSWE